MHTMIQARGGLRHDRQYLSMRNIMKQSCKGGCVNTVGDSLHVYYSSTTYDNSYTFIQQKLNFSNKKLLTLVRLCVF